MMMMTIELTSLYSMTSYAFYSSQQGEPHYLQSTVASEASGVSLARKEAVHHDIEEEENRRYAHHKQQEALVHAHDHIGHHVSHREGHSSHSRSEHRSPSVDSKHSHSTAHSALTGHSHHSSKGHKSSTSSVHSTASASKSSTSKRKSSTSSAASVSSHVSKSSQHSTTTSHAAKHKKHATKQSPSETSSRKEVSADSGLETDLVALLELNSDEELDEDDEQMDGVDVAGGVRERGRNASLTGRERTESHISHSTLLSTATGHSKGTHHTLGSGGATSQGGGVIIVENDHSGLYDPITIENTSVATERRSLGGESSLALSSSLLSGHVGTGGGGSTVLPSSTAGEGSLSALVGELVHEAGLDKDITKEEDLKDAVPGHNVHSDQQDLLGNAHAERTI
jgi:hypothetical protein